MAGYASYFYLLATVSPSETQAEFAAPHSHRIEPHSGRLPCRLNGDRSHAPSRDRAEAEASAPRPNIHRCHASNTPADRATTPVAESSPCHSVGIRILN